MAAGDLSALLDTYAGSGYSYGFYYFHIAGNYYGIVSHVGSGAHATLKTFYVDDVSGDITLVDGPDDTTLDSDNQHYAVKISDGHWAIFDNYRTSVGPRAVTIHLSDVGVIGSVISTFTLENSTYVLRGCPVRVRDGLIVGNLNKFTAPNTGCYIVTWSFALDGTTEARVDLVSDGFASSNFTSFMSLLDADKIIVVRDNPVLTPTASKVLTFRIDLAGYIYSISSLALITATTGGIVKVGEGIWMAGLQNYLATFSVSAAGNIGAIIDTDTTLAVGTPFLARIPGGVFVLGYYTFTGTGYRIDLVSFSVTSAGVIGAQIDTVQVTYISTNNLSSLQVLYSAGGVFSTVWMDNELGYNIFSYGIEAGLDLPTSDLVRITGLRHIYRQGFYREEVFLGGLNASERIGDAYIPRHTPPLDADVDLKMKMDTFNEFVKALGNEPTPPPAAPAQPLYQPSPWQQVTPWNEAQGETFPSWLGDTITDIWSDVTDWWKGIFG